MLAGITAAHRTENRIIEEKTPATFDEEMEEVEKWAKGEEPPHTFGYYCGLAPVNFPAPAQLNEREMKMVLKAFGQMMFSLNLYIGLPKLLPVPIAYTMTIDTFTC